MKAKIIAILCLVPLFASCKGGQQQKEEDLTVSVVKVAPVMEKGEKEFSFLTQPFRTSQLSFRVGGPIDRLEVYAGNYYQRGNIIAEIDNRDYRIRKERAEAVYHQAKAEYERIEALYNKNNLSASTYEKAKATYTSAKTSFETATNELEDTRLMAPFNGYIGEVFVEKFQDVRAAQTIVTFMDIDRLKIEAYVTQEIAFSLQPGSSATLTLDVQPDRKLEAKIMEVSKSTTANNLSYLVTALLPNADRKLLSGLSGKIYFPATPTTGLSDSATAQPEKTSVCIPQTALCHRPTEGNYVWIVDAANQVNQRKVTIGKLLPDGKVSIANGLQEDETIAVSRLRFLSNGMKVGIATTN